MHIYIFTHVFIDVTHQPTDNMTNVRLPNSRPQQTQSWHLGLALFILFLTIYPYLFNTNNARLSVAAYSSDDLNLKHNMIEKFDIIQSDEIQWSKTISIRSLDEKQPKPTDDRSEKEIGQQNNVLDAIPSWDAKQINREHSQIPQEINRKVKFFSLGRSFSLILNKTTHLTTDDLTITLLDSRGKETIVPFNRADYQTLDGSLEGESGSRATAAFNKFDKLMTAQINTDQDTIVVEPMYLHKNNLLIHSQLNSTVDNLTNPDYNEALKLFDRTMIVYRLRDHKHFQNVSSNDTSHSQFDPAKFCGAESLTNMNDNFNLNGANPSEQTLQPEIEEIYKIYDKPLGHQHKRARRSIEYLLDKSGEKTRCTLHLVADYLFYKNIGRGDLQTTINYLLALVNRVNQIYLPTNWQTGEGKGESINNIGFTVQNITIHQEFTRSSSNEDHYNMQTDKVWQAREFLDNFSKYSPPRHYCLAHLLTYRQFDSPVLGLAYVASTRFGTIGGLCSPTQQKGDFFYKHNTGISTSKGINGETLITRQADLVVAHELGHNLGAEHDSNDCRPSPSQGGAYLMHPFAVLGFEKNNRAFSNCSRVSIGQVIKRKGPTCFVSVADHVCGNGIVEDDEECDGGGIGFGHNDPCCDSSCRFTPGSQCSNRHSWCCDRCHISPAGFPCRQAEEYYCKQASYCDGSSAECPPSPPSQDNKTCVGRGVCQGGDCKPFCEARELQSCLCNTPADACKLCCRTTMNGTCVPYNNKAPYLPDGVLCYRGVCEKGRCEQPIQDVVERLWDVIEDINFSTLVKFLRNNIILVVLIISIPIWCIFSHYINEFDKQVKQDVMNSLAKRKRERLPPSQSPFLPRLFVGDELNNSTSEL